MTRVSPEAPVRPPARRAVWLDALPYLAALVSCAPLLFGGFPQGHDWPYELARVAEYSHALADGQLPPHWAPNLYGGYGSPVFLFYAPLFSALAAAAAALLDSLAAGASLALVVSSIAGVVAMRRLFAAVPDIDPGAGRLAATIFALHPYLIGDKLLRNANAEFAALSLLPLVLAGLLQLDRRPVRGVLVVAGGLAGVALSHNLTALVALALLVGGTLWLHGWRGAARARLSLTAGIALGLSVSAFLWLPVVALHDAVRLDDLLTGKFDFHRQWASLGDSFGYSQFFSAGVLTPLGLGFAAWVSIRCAGDGFPGRRLLAGMLVAAGIAIALQRPFSTPLWEALPGLAYAQFPWRFMGLLAFASAVAAAIALTRVAALCPPVRRSRLELAVFALCVANAWPALSSYRPLSPAQLDRIELTTQPGQLRRSELNVTVLDEYLPTGADAARWKRAARGGGNAWKVVGADATIERVDDKGSGISLRVTAPAGTRLRLARWSFPGWEATLDGAPLAIETDRTGGIDLQIPAPGGELELVRRAPVSRRIGLAVSALGIALWLAIYGFERRRRSAEAAAGLAAG